MDSSSIDVETFVYDDGGGVQSEVVIGLEDIEFIVVVDKPFRVKKKGVEVSETQKEPRVFWRRPGDTQPRGQLAGSEGYSSVQEAMNNISEYLA